MAQILIGNGMILMVNREDSSRKSRSVLVSPASTHPSYLTEEDALPDPFNLERFVDAQADVYSEVLTELREGRKRSHWIWFIFPQMKGLGHSPRPPITASGLSMRLWLIFVILSSASG